MMNEHECLEWSYCEKEGDLCYTTRENGITEKLLQQRETRCLCVLCL